MDSSDKGVFTRKSVLACLAVMFVAALILWGQGRVWWCRAGDYSPWSWRVLSEHNSQHLIDPYSFTHILHGVMEFWLVGLVFRTVPVAWRLVIAVFVEGTWEIVENTDYVINRYREATISLNYYGDSIVNSLSDITCCAIGFLIAYKLRFWKSLALFVATEAVLIVSIRDSLLLNIVMLIYPVDAIKVWQAAG
jgi:hypothetical protein